MREETKKREYCKECGRISYSGEIRVVCDYCKLDITKDYYDRDIELPKLTIFLKDSNTHDYEFCNWKCFLGWIKKVKLNHFSFISLPYLKEEDLIILQKQLKEEAE